MAIRFGAQQPGGSDSLSSPVIQWLGAGNVWVIAGTYLFACIFAPFFEETMFRGALLTHLCGRMSLFPALLIMGVIFASIHPQGLIALPALTSIALGLGMIRTMRNGSLIGNMTAHALHNGMIVTVAVLALMLSS